MSFRSRKWVSEHSRKKTHNATGPIVLEAQLISAVSNNGLSIDCERASPEVEKMNSVDVEPLQLDAIQELIDKGSCHIEAEQKSIC